MDKTATWNIFPACGIMCDRGKSIGEVVSWDTVNEADLSMTKERYDDDGR